ncbi:MAG: penicillin-binding protein 2 [Candidatus Omnitrophota bacterium]|nr:penicillin-binding protein 2 [Candidatus Omnitrophota bacterium]
MRDRILTSAISAFFIMLAVGLFYTQIIRCPYYTKLSKNNSIRIIPIDGPRGIIFDRNGIPLVSNRLSFDAAVIYRELSDRAKLVRVLKETLGMSGIEIINSLEKASLGPYTAVTIAEDVDKDKAVMLEEASFNIGGLVVETKSKRDYRLGKDGSHIFGYLGEVAEEELEGLREYGYRMGDLMGRSGLEKYYESYLKGVDGGTQIEVDSKGRQTRVLGLKEPSVGKDLYLTIDADLQSTCDRLLGEHRGAVIVMDPRSGEVLALASHPPFDPNIFVKPNTSGRREFLFTNKAGRPMSNRAISGLYPPGSVFKIVTAAAALETRKISPDTIFTCPGYYKLGSARFNCWKETGHGPQNLRKGIMNSCNFFFYSAGRAAGVDAMESYARLFGYGALTGIDLPDEVKGLVPGKAWKRSAGKGAWYEGETVNYAIGQGYLMVTPIQVLCMTSVIANGGSLVRPYIVKKINGDEMRSEKKKKIGLRTSTIQRIREGMFDVINDPNGTAKRARAEGVVAAGKTGTAENPLGKTHAWFAGFAPYDDPRICVVVFLEHGGKGGIEPAAIAHGIFEEAKKKGYL